MTPTKTLTEKEQMNIVIVGHVDHGKSTVIGRLLADTDSLPEGKLEQVKKVCEINSKPFEYAFLLDALKDEQEQGITIDAARCFFSTQKRHYIVIDAPGHIEFLKNMITGAARAEAALLVIDAHEGVQENSRRHGYMLSLLGIKQVVVLVNKMDLVHYDHATYSKIQEEYTAFLSNINVAPIAFVPISAREGDNIVTPSQHTAWYTGPSVLSHIDNFRKDADVQKKALRFPVQDVYKFTAQNDDRRIIAGRVETGELSVGDEIVFYPSGKASKVKSIEGFNLPIQQTVSAGYATGITMETQIYIKPGEIMCVKGQSAPQVGTEFKARLFWLGKVPMTQGKKYKLKIGTKRATVFLKSIQSVLDASDLSSSSTKQIIERHDVAECVLQTPNPVAFDTSAEYEATGRFVIIDDYEIAGGGIVSEGMSATENAIESYIANRDALWIKSHISSQKRRAALKQDPRVILITADKHMDRVSLAKSLEEALFEKGAHVYSLSLPNIISGIGSDLRSEADVREETVRRIGEIGHAFTDAGLIFISTVPELEDFEAELIQRLIAPVELTIVNLGPKVLNQFPINVTLEAKADLETQVLRILESITLYK